MREQIEAVLARVRPCLQPDGADVEIVSLSDDGVVTLRITGECCGCPMTKVALLEGLEATLRSEVSGLRRVEVVRGKR
jgi:Fe-S cluster biogenesis protein NfuA